MQRFPTVLLTVAVGALACCRAGAQAAATPAAPAPGDAGQPLRRLLVLNKGEATVSVFDPATREEVARCAVDDGPHEVAVAPDGRTAVVCNYGGRTPGSTLSVIDVVAGATARTFALTRVEPAGPAAAEGADGAAGAAGRERRYLRPHGIRFLPDGRRVLVTSERSRRLLVVDVAAGAVVRTFETRQPTTHMVALAADARTAFGTSIQDGTLSIFDLADATARVATVVPTGAGAEGLAVSPTTGHVWVGNREADTLSVFDPARREVIATIDTDAFPIRVECTPDGGHVLVSCAEAGTVQVFDCRSRELARTIVLGGDKTEHSPLPVGICIEPDGRRAWIACTRGEFLAIVDLQTFTMVDRVQARQGPDGMAFAVVR